MAEGKEGQRGAKGATRQQTWHFDMGESRIAALIGFVCYTRRHEKNKIR
jgi:hypothetical protein